MPRNATAALGDLGDGVIHPIRPLQSITLDDFVRREFPPRENLLAPWLPSQGIAMVFAPRGVGKTHLALGVAYAVASGGAFLRWEAPRPRRVLLIDGEMPAVALQERMKAVVMKAQCAPPEADYFRLLPYDLFRDGNAPDIGTEEGQNALEPVLAGVDLIVVDNISTVCSGKENEAEGWALIQAWALKQRRAGRSVLFVHHAGKGGDQRGTSKREDIMDSVIRLSNPNDYEVEEGARFMVNFTKARGIHGADVMPFEAKLIDGFWACSDAEDAYIPLVRELLAENMSVRRIAEETGLSKSKVQRIKTKLEEGQ